LSTTAYRVTAAVTFAGMLAGLLASIPILLEAVAFSGYISSGNLKRNSGLLPNEVFACP